jgi:hypothetical protein
METVFYSWQSDLPNATNRGLIGRALEDAARAIRKDQSLAVEPVVDRDTLGTPGTPDIAATIFSKIDSAAAFVADVSLINADTDGRPCPNPNVLIELGYAKKALGQARVVMIMNTAFGGPEMLPFDLRMRRVVTYHAEKDAEERAAPRASLRTTLEAALRAILTAEGDAPGAIIKPISLSEQLRSSIESSRRDQATLARRFVSTLITRLDELHPRWQDRPDLDEPFIEALNSSVAIVGEFATIADQVATFDATDAGEALFESFEQVLERYETPPGFSGTFYETDFDFFRFHGHELLVSLVSPIVREKRWQLLNTILDRDLYVPRLTELGRSGMVSFAALSEFVRLLDYRKQRLRLNRASIHADLLRERHSSENLSAASPLNDFVDADLFLFFRAEAGRQEAGERVQWIPWSVLNLGGRVPRFLVDATRRRLAEPMLQPLGLGNVEAFRRLVATSVPRLRGLFDAAGYYPLEFDPDSIATR